MARTTKADMAAQGEHAVADALRALGHEVTDAPADAGWDLTAVIDGIEVRIRTASAAIVTPEAAGRMFAADGPGRARIARVAVGDLVTAAAQRTLRDAGWGWLDRRGHLLLRAKGVHIDTAVPADARAVTGTPARPISGSAGMSLAAALLLSPEDPPSLRAVARRVGLSHTAIVAASTRLKAAALVRADGRPLVPELFWALADEWRPRAVALAALPTVDADADGTGWAVVGTVAAAAWGAPVAIGATYPPDFAVASATEMRQVVLRVGEAVRFEERACTVAVAPTPLVCAERTHRSLEPWTRLPFAHGLFAALDLAQDRARGAEILAAWEPTGFARVW